MLLCSASGISQRGSYAPIAAQGRADPAGRSDCRAHAGDASPGRIAPSIFQSLGFRQGQALGIEPPPDRGIDFEEMPRRAGLSKITPALILAFGAPPSRREAVLLLGAVQALRPAPVLRRHGRALRAPTT